MEHWKAILLLFGQYRLTHLGSSLVGLVLISSVSIYNMYIYVRTYIQLSDPVEKKKCKEKTLVSSSKALTRFGSLQDIYSKVDIAC